MKKNYTHISIVLDRSGSMRPRMQDVLGSVKSLIQQHRESTTGDSTCTISLTFFNDKIDHAIEFKDVMSISDQTIDDLNIYANNFTSLRDAIYSNIINTGQHLSKLDESERPEKVMVVIQTDGMENSSTECSIELLKETITEQKEKYQWNFLFIGANEKEIMNARNLYGFDAHTAITYNEKNTSNSLNTVFAKTVSYRNAIKGSDQFAASLNFSDNEKALMNQDN